MEMHASVFTFENKFLEGSGAYQILDTESIT